VDIKRLVLIQKSNTPTEFLVLLSQQIPNITVNSTAFYCQTLLSTILYTNIYFILFAIAINLFFSLVNLLNASIRVLNHLDAIIP